jgi:hypothetical protein
MPLSIVRKIFKHIFEGNYPRNHIHDNSIDIQHKKCGCSHNESRIRVPGRWKWWSSRPSPGGITKNRRHIKLSSEILGWVHAIPYDSLPFAIFLSAYSNFTPVRFVPSWFPGAGFKRYAKSITNQLAMFENVPFDWAKKQIVRTSV